MDNRRLNEFRAAATEVFGIDDVHHKGVYSLECRCITLASLVHFAELARIPAENLDICGDYSGWVVLEWTE